MSSPIQLRGRAALRNLSDDPSERITDNVMLPRPPRWLLEQVDWGAYSKAMSMSTVSVEFNNPNFMPHVIWRILKQFRGTEYTDGCIIDVSTATHTTNEDEITPKASKPSIKGRKPINVRPQAKRPHGKYRAFGRSVEVHLAINLDTAFKGESRRLYRIKFFSTNMQVPGCCSEDHSDVRKITRFMYKLLQLGYAAVPAPPPGFEAVQRIITEGGENALLHAMPSDISSVAVGDIRIYSRNYTMHYTPLTEDRVGGEQARGLHLQDLNHYILTHEDVVEGWLERFGLVSRGVNVEYTGTSETANRRLQYIFTTPQLIREGTHDRERKSQVTKVFLEGSGKMNFEFTNNYYWEDCLWRLFGFMHQSFRSEFIKPRMSTTPSRANADRIASYFAQDMSVDRIAAFLTDINSDGE